jgi:LEA14-like dessication related protein
MKRIALAALLAVVAVSSWAFDIPKPSAEIRRFQLDSITLRDVTFLFDLAVKNPYPVSLPFDGMTLAFTVEGARVFTAASQGGFTVPANGEKTNTFTVTLAYDAIISLVKNYIEKDWLTTVIDGTLVIPLPKVPMLPKLPPNVTFKYSLSQKIPAIKPKLALQGFAVRPPTAQQVAEAVAKAGAKVDTNKALGVFKDVLAGKTPAAPVIDPADLDVPLTVDFTLVIRNEAKGPLSFNALHYELFVNAESLVLGDATSIVKKPDGDHITVSNVFSSQRLSKNVKALFAKKGGSFAVKGSAALKFPDEIRKEPVPLSFDEKGTFSIR